MGIIARTGTFFRRPAVWKTLLAFTAVAFIASSAHYGLKNVLNYLGQPQISFSLFAIVFVWAFFKRPIWTRTGTLLAMTGITLTLGIMLLDKNFAHNLLKPDNAPIFLMIFFFSFFLWVSMWQAHNNDRRMEEMLPPAEKETSNQKTWVWPDLVYIEFICMIVWTVVLVAWSIAIPAPLEEPANPGNTPNPSKAPWYFLGLQELLVYFDPWMAGVVLPSIIVVGLMAIPYIDINPKGSGYYCFKDRRLAILTFCIGFFVMWCYMIVLGTILRGPGWNYFGPFEEWNPHKVVAANNVNLSEIIWIKMLYPLGSALNIDWLKQGVPDVSPDYADWKNWVKLVKKEFAGILLLGFYFLVLPVMLARTKLKNFYERLGMGRYSVAIFLFLVMATVPIKMYARWLISLKYIFASPWINF
jgi:hypothetical protein